MNLYQIHSLMTSISCLNCSIVSSSSCLGFFNILLISRYWSNASFKTSEVKNSKLRRREYVPNVQKRRQIQNKSYHMFWNSFKLMLICSFNLSKRFIMIQFAWAEPNFSIVRLCLSNEPVKIPVEIPMTLQFPVLFRPGTFAFKSLFFCSYDRIFDG